MKRLFTAALVAGTVLTTSVSAAGAGVVLADNHSRLQLGQSVRNRGDYPAALREFRNATKQGQLVALNNLGRIYVSGEGIVRAPSSAYVFDEIMPYSWKRRVANSEKFRLENIIPKRHFMAQKIIFEASSNKPNRNTYFVRNMSIYEKKCGSILAIIAVDAARIEQDKNYKPIHNMKTVRKYHARILRYIQRGEYRKCARTADRLINTTFRYYRRDYLKWLK